jgi:hypothetical protein
MTARKEHRKREPLLNTVARKLGHAAGSFSKATQGFTQALSAVPEAVTAKVRDAALFGASSDNAGSRPRARKSSTTGRKRKVKKTASIAKKRSPGARRSGPGAKSRKKKKTK